MKPAPSWFWLLLVVPLALGIARLRFDVEIMNLLPGKLGVVQGLKLYQQHFSNARQLIIGLEAPTADEGDVAARALAQILRLQIDVVADVTWQPAWMENPSDATELVAYLWLNQPPAVFSELTNRLAKANLTNTLNETREQLATSLSPNEIAIRGYDPYGLTRLPPSVSSAAPGMGTGEELFASPDGTFRLLFVEAKPDITSYRACRAWLADVQRIIAKGRNSGAISTNVTLHYTGRPAFVTEIAGGMENDMIGSSGSTLLVIGLLFWLTHRRMRPLLWLLFLLALILAGTTALGALLLGTINVVSMGFASILLGLAEDFGIVIYQESRSHPELNADQLRHAVAPGIFWSAVTTAGAFFTLNLSSLPGLGQLGSLVGIGIILAAGVMLYGYLPPLLRFRRKRDSGDSFAVAQERFLLFTPQRLLPPKIVWFITVVLVVVSTTLLLRSGPHFDHSSNVLKPKNSQADAALEKIKARFGRSQEPLWILIPGQNETEIGQRLAQASSALSQTADEGLISGFTLPNALWPNPENQKVNRTSIARLLQERAILRPAALSSGFNSDSLLLTETILNYWEHALASPVVFWPTNQASNWILGKVVSRTTNGFLVLGLIHPTTNAMATKKFAAEFPKALQQHGIILSGWELLGRTVFDTVVKELPRVLIPIFMLVVASLWLAFRNLREVVLSLVTLLFSGVCLWSTMALLKWDWNILNLMALPLLLGMGVDYSIHIQLALRRYAGDLLTVRRSVGRALLLAGSTTVVGFGSLAFSSNAGMASLGRVCALGITLTLMTAVYLLPVWWQVRKVSARVSGRTTVG